MFAHAITKLLFVGYASAISVTLYSKTGASSAYAVNPDGSCFTLHGGTLQQYNDNLKAMDIPSGYQCAIWQNYNCQGRHTNNFGGFQQISQVCENHYPNNPTNDWSRGASSFKCCPAGSTASWCAGSIPGCT